MYFDKFPEIRMKRVYFRNSDFRFRFFLEDEELYFKDGDVYLKDEISSPVPLLVPESPLEA